MLSLHVRYQSMVFSLQFVRACSRPPALVSIGFRCSSTVLQHRNRRPTKTTATPRSLRVQRSSAAAKVVGVGNMANAVRKICTKIGNSHQYLLGTVNKPSAYGGHLVPADNVQRLSARTQDEKKHNVNCAAGSVFRQSRPMYFAAQPVANKQSVVAAVEWFNNNEDTKKTISSRLNTSVTKPDESVKSTSSDNDSTSNPKELPSVEQLNYIYDKLAEDLPTMFRQNLNYALYHPKLVFENNIRGTKSVGLEYFMTTISILRLLGHIKYAFVKFDILKITKHPEDGTIKMRWRIKGISGMKVFLKFWKFRLWNLEQVIKENIESWHDGYSVFSVGSDGLIYKLTADKMQPYNDSVIEDKTPLATKLALFLGLSPQLNDLGCLVTFDSEQTNELLKMVMMSLEDVI